MTATQQRQIAIGPEFFAKARNDYSDWRWALVREFFQNSVDCGSTAIHFDAQYHNGTTVVTVRNNGQPMSEDVLVNKLLSLGSSGKDFRGSVGGFGKAKEVLYFCWQSYTIRTGKCLVQGSGATYTLTHHRDTFQGTESTIVIPDNCATELEEQAQQFAFMASVRPTFTINGRKYEASMRKGSFRRDLGFGRVYTNRQATNLLIVRIGGIPMFARYCKHEGCVLVELEGTSGDSLTSNRDGLRYDPSMALDSFISDLTTNKRRALKQVTTEYIRYDGQKVLCEGFAKQAAAHRGSKAKSNQLPQALLDAIDSGEVLPMVKAPNGNTQYDRQDVVTETAPETSRCKAFRLASSFTIKNETGHKVKPQYRPDSEKFGQYAYRLIVIWTRMLVEMHKIDGRDDEFTVGFLFTNDNDTKALWEHSGQHGTTYYINPVLVEGTKWAKQYRYGLPAGRQSMHQLVAYALHEYVHGKGYVDHDEDFAAAMTAMVVKLVAHGTFIKCFIDA